MGRVLAQVRQTQGSLHWVLSRCTGSQGVGNAQVLASVVSCGGEYASHRAWSLLATRHTLSGLSALVRAAGSRHPHPTQARGGTLRTPRGRHPESAWKRYSEFFRNDTRRHPHSTQIRGWHPTQVLGLAPQKYRGPELGIHPK